MTTKAISILLLIFLGLFGAHRFFLGNPGIGGAYIVGTICSLALISLGIGGFGFLVLGGCLVYELFDFIKTPADHFKSRQNKEVDDLEGKR